MDIKKFIDSGTLEQYCLGQLNEEEQAFVIQMSMLYPEVKEELTAIELAMENLAALNAVSPADNSRQKIISALGFVSNDYKFDLNDLPVADENSDHEVWLNTLVHLIPDNPAEDFSIKVLRQDEGLTQMLVIAKIDVPDETHADTLESFLILKGICECNIGGQLLQLGPGGFIDIPLHTAHDIRMISPHVVAILQHKAI